MTQYIIVDADGNEHTEPTHSKKKANKLLERAEETGTLDYSIKTIGRAFR